VYMRIIVQAIRFSRLLFIVVYVVHTMYTFPEHEVRRFSEQKHLRRRSGSANDTKTDDLG